MKKTQHKIPASLMQTRISQKVQEELHKLQDINQDDFRRGYETASRDVEGLYKPKIEEQKQQLLDQAKRHQIRVEELKDQVQASSAQFVLGTLETQQYSGWIVENWRRGWMWLSNWMFAVIAWVAFYGIPPELLALIPEANRENVIPILSALGVICRFIDQSRKKPLPPIEEDL